MKDKPVPPEMTMEGGESRRQVEILLGVTGCIGAYKAAEVIRLLRGQGFGVQVLMTRHAGWFMTAGTFQTLSGRPVLSDLFQPRSEGSIEHIEIARRAHLFLVAPATANCLGKFAAGIADDFLSTVYLAFKGPVLLAPAMNAAMYRHPAVQQNLEILRRRGVRLLGPDAGDLACGETGPGRLIPPQRIVREVSRMLKPQASAASLAGCKVLVSAGPTREPIDAVRFLSNPATGKMGFALARAALQKGARVVLVSGPTELAAPEGVELIRVQTVAQMRESLLLHVAGAHLIMMAAAVGDLRVAAPAQGKTQKADLPAVLKMVAAPDILAEIGKVKGTAESPVLMGFAAETDDLEEHARQKLERKNLDYLVANRVDVPGVGFAVSTNQVVVFSRHGSPQRWPLLTKKEVAERLLELVVRENFCAAPGHTTPLLSHDRS